MLDVTSRKIAAHEVPIAEPTDRPAQLICKASLSEGSAVSRVELHSDHGSAMKGVTVLATLEKLVVVPSFSRVSPETLVG
ncbi:hypothetical protein GCM10022212_31070 [Actimicrobium antarcticum]|uniref:Transposase n=1 Tax=Actimicrobium antarcticum TaxID=1051899 RepID=A0ABP7TSE3_9BURK